MNVMNGISMALTGSIVGCVMYRGCSELISCYVYKNNNYKELKSYKVIDFFNLGLLFGIPSYFVGFYQKPLIELVFKSRIYNIKKTKK